MKHEKSCGIIPFVINNKALSVLIIKQNNGVVGFPKGHVESNETEEETALRECYEETGLKAKIVEGYREETTYYMSEYDVEKTVVFFAGVIENLDIHKQDSEVSDIKIVSVEEALNLISFEDTKRIFIKAIEHINC